MAAAEARVRVDKASSLTMIPRDKYCYSVRTSSFILYLYIYAVRIWLLTLCYYIILLQRTYNIYDMYVA